MASIPEREPIQDTFHGKLIRVGGNNFLTCDPGVDGELLTEGQIIIRYGIRYAVKHHLSIVPDLVALDYGEMLTGYDAWHFLLNKSNLYPRADVLGYRNDGLDEMVTVKQLDLALPIEVLAFADHQSAKPIASINAIIGCPNDEIPERIAQYLPQLTALADWTPND